MYTKIIFIVVGTHTKKQVKIIKEFTQSRNKKENLKLEIELNHYLRNIEACISLVQNYHENLEIEESVKLCFIASMHHPAYDDLKKYELLYKSKEYIISKNKKFEKIQTEISDNIIVNITPNVRKKTERQTKVNNVFSGSHIFKRFSHIA